MSKIKLFSGMDFSGKTTIVNGINIINPIIDTKISKKRLTYKYLFFFLLFSIKS